jgi:hypothetical protein
MPCGRVLESGQLQRPLRPLVRRASFTVRRAALKQDFPAGSARWISVVSPDDPAGTQLALEPNGNPAAKAFQKAMFEQKIPLAAFEVDDLAAEFARLSDGCGNLIQLYQLTRR